MLFRVTAEGMQGSTFVYETQGPEDATDTEVLCEVYRMHGVSLREGTQTEPLGPFSSVERVGGF